MNRSLQTILILSLLLGACASPLGNRKPLPPEQQYLLEDLQPVERARAVEGPSLRVSAPVAAPGYGGARLLYIREANHLEAYAYHRWVDAPARMLEPLLVHSLESAGRFAPVVPSHVSARTALRLDTQLLYLHQRFMDGGSRVELGLRAELVDTDSARVLDGEVFRVEEPVPLAEPDAVVEAANRAATVLLKQLRRWIAEVPPLSE